MKLKILNLFFCTFLLSVGSATPNKIVNLQNNLKTIHLDGENNLPDGILVTLFKEDKKAGWSKQGDLSFSKNGFSLNVIENTNYIIKITKKGYASRTYCFSTGMKKSDNAITDIKFSFDLNFFKYKNETENSSSDLSVSLSCSDYLDNCVAINKL